MGKKFIISLFLFLTFTSVVIADTIVKIVEFRQPVITMTGEYSVISFEGTRLLGEPGKATLPFYPVKLLLPPGEIAATISIKFEKPIKIQGEFLLLPRQYPRPLSDTMKTAWYMDDNFYRSSGIYPSSLKYKVETQFYSGFGIALSAFTPVRYNPAVKEVSYFQRVIVTITTAPDPDANEHQRNYSPSESKKGILSDIIQNTDMITQYNSGREWRTNEYDYLIITQNQFAPEFDTLASFYKPRGIQTKITTTEYISSNITGADLQEKIRNYIISENDQFGIEYVLIGGDAEIVPYRGFYCSVQSDHEYTDNNIPADLYYSALDGNWNTDGDGLWAEPGEDDLYPEVGIGRMTFSDTAELHNMLHKTMLYQSDPVEGELTKPLLAGEYLYSPPPTWGSDYMKLLVGYRTDNGYTTQGIPNTHPRDTLYDRYAGWTEEILRNHINSGRPWLHHCGHANYTYAMKMNNDDITNANFSQANGVNHNYTIVYTHGCMCGGFDAADCIAERMVGIDNFAVAFIGNSRYGWFNQGTTDGPSEHLHREFMDALYSDSLYHIGMAHLKSKMETAPYVVIDTGGAGEFEPGATRWCFYDNNVLGDPMMAVWTNEPGQQLATSYPAFIPLDAGSVTVHLSGPTGSYRNFTCSIYRNDTLFGAGKTNSSGNAIITLEDGLTEGPVSLVVSGYNILPHYYEILVCDYWLGLTKEWNNVNNWYSGNIPDSSSYLIIPADPSGPYFPYSSQGQDRHCRAIFIEPGALFHLNPGETFSISGD